MLFGNGELDTFEVDSLTWLQHQSESHHHSDLISEPCKNDCLNNALPAPQWQFQEISPSHKRMALLSLASSCLSVAIPFKPAYPSSL